MCLAYPAFAAEDGQAVKNDGTSGYQLPEVVVTESKTAQKQETVTQKIDVIYADEFDQQIAPDRNLSELLKNTSGQFVNPLSRNDANWGSFGGLGPQYNLYLLDGLPIDSFADSMSLDPWAFERVELYKGPASVMYPNYLTMDFAGNEAPMAGLTNFILKDKIDSAATRIRVGEGSYKTTDTSFYHQDHKGNLNFFFGGNYERSDYTDYGTANSWLNIIQDPEYEKTKLYFKGTYLFDRDDHKLSLFVNHTQQTGDAGRPNRDFDHNYDTANATYSNQVNDLLLTSSFKTGYRSYDRRWGDDNYPTSLSLTDHAGVIQKIYPTDLVFNLKHSGNSLLTFGASSQYSLNLQDIQRGRRSAQHRERCDRQNGRRLFAG